jgi:hypothetical protein
MTQLPQPVVTVEIKRGSAARPIVLSTGGGGTRASGQRVLPGNLPKRPRSPRKSTSSRYSNLAQR